MHRRGLVLSGGGFFGAFQAGAYESLGNFDCVVGASAGSLNGWAIASGMPPRQLQELWLEAARTARAGLHWPRYLGDGILDTSRLEVMVRSLVRDWRLRVDFGVVVSQGFGCRQVLIRNEAVDADAILASCAVPVLLPAKRIGGRLSVDGGLRDACPLWAAREMGADKIVGVNVWTHLPWWWLHRKIRGKPAPGVTMIKPAERLGALRRSALASPEEVAAWIELGRRAARDVFARQ
jgi:NTE family protein